MPAIHPDTPVIVGVGQYTKRVKLPDTVTTPIELAAVAGDKALKDAGISINEIDVLTFTRTIIDSGLPGEVPDLLVGIWKNPAASVMRKMGRDPHKARAGADGGAKTTFVHSALGGNTPQSLVNHFAAEIAKGSNRAEGQIKTALLTGGEAMYALQGSLGLLMQKDPSKAMEMVQNHRKEGDKDASVPFEPFQTAKELSTPMELRHGLKVPIEIYPTLETAIRASKGHGPEEHMLYMGKLFEKFCKVASENTEYSWKTDYHTAEEIATPTKRNRFISYPYTKWLNSIWDLNQGAAVLLTSYSHAKQCGVADEKIVFLHGAGDCYESPLFLSERPDLTKSTGMTYSFESAFRQANVKPRDIAFFDIYSCFPSAVEMACDVLGFDGVKETRPLTVTGGLPYHGGPGNNYVMHSIAAMVETCRKNPRKLGFVNANGGYVSKHAAGIYSTSPPLNGGRRWERDSPVAIQQAVDASVKPVPVAPEPFGQGTIEAYSVEFKKGKPSKATIIGRLETGQRFVALNTDEATLTAMVANEYVGRKGRVSSKETDKGVMVTFTPSTNSHL
eukprot:Clim_evm78s236 gene=Clim_evmTU78s236